jgi:hypothetical protein
LPPPPSVVPSRRTGWKVGFWMSAVATVGLGAGIVGSGMTVIGKQTDKENAVKDANTTFTNYVNAQVNLQPTDDAKDVTRRSLTTQFHDDVCQLAHDAGVTTVTSICDSGDKWATVTNVFIGLTVAAGLATGFFYYKAYLQKDPEQPPAPETVTRRREQPRVEWMVTPSLGPKGGGLGLHLRF